MKLTETKLRSIIREELQEMNYERERDMTFSSKNPRNPEEVIEAAASFEHMMQADNAPSGQYIGFHDAEDIPDEAYKTLNDYMNRVEGRDANRKEKRAFKKLVAKKNREADADREMYM